MSGEDRTTDGWVALARKSSGSIRKNDSIHDYVIASLLCVLRVARGPGQGAGLGARARARAMARAMAMARARAMAMAMARAMARARARASPMSCDPPGRATRYLRAIKTQ